MCTQVKTRVKISYVESEITIYKLEVQGTKGTYTRKEKHKRDEGNISEIQRDISEAQGEL